MVARLSSDTEDLFDLEPYLPKKPSSFHEDKAIIDFLSKGGYEYYKRKCEEVKNM